MQCHAMRCNAMQCDSLRYARANALTVFTSVPFCVLQPAQHVFVCIDISTSNYSYSSSLCMPMPALPLEQRQKHKHEAENTTLTRHIPSRPSITSPTHPSLHPPNSPSASTLRHTYLHMQPPLHTRIYAQRPPCVHLLTASSIQVSHPHHTTASKRSCQSPT